MNTNDPGEILARLEQAPAGRQLWEVAASLQAAGAQVVLIGGAVRDGLLGHPIKDVDVEVFGIRPDRLKELLSRFGEVLSVGQSFGVFLIRGLAVDFSLPRKDNKVAPGHRGFEVEFDPALSFEAASRRRDLTINSMGIDFSTGELLDAHGGRADLTAGILRATDPESFGEDPLRGMRVAQMSARFCMTVDPTLSRLCASLDLSELPGERLHEEFRKLLLLGSEPSRGLAFLRETRLVTYFPELEALIDVPQDPAWHPEGDAWNHTLMALDRGAELRCAQDGEDEAMMFAVLCHDFGKPEATSEIDGRVRSLAHDQLGIAPTRSFLERLHVSGGLRDKIVALVEHHLAPAHLVGQGATPKAYRRLARKLARAGASLELLERVARADHLGRTTEEAIAGRFAAGDAFLAQASSLDVATAGPKDIVLGRHLIARGYEPSRDFATILDRCREIQDETGLTDPEVILERALSHTNPPNRS